ncbi:MAG TPA: hypothetical protein VIE91_01000 [Methylophilaceae bacterium]
MQGVILFVTLIMLVILTISGVAMMQIMEAGVSAAGNIAFRQASLRVADVAMEDARIWLLAQDQSTLQDPAVGTDYYANLATPFNPVTDSWSKCVDQDGDGTCDTFSGYKLYYVIHRMAKANGACSATSTLCLFPSNASSAGTTEGQSQSGGTGANQGNIAGTTGLVFYRITVKVSGPRHNINYVQALMY